MHFLIPQFCYALQTQVIKNVGGSRNAVLQVWR